MWSYNTHPGMFPEAQELARLSDVVGASHSKDFTLFKYNSDASPGLKLLAEQGNTTNLELEIYEKVQSFYDKIQRVRQKRSFANLLVYLPMG